MEPRGGGWTAGDLVWGEALLIGAGIVFGPILLVLAISAILYEGDQLERLDGVR